MAITATHIGQSTIQVSATFTSASGAANLNSFDKFSQTIADAITGTRAGVAGTLSGIVFTGSGEQTSTGWTLFDSFWGGKDNVNNISSPLYTQVFRSLNEDGVSYKNIIIRYDTKNGTINTSTCDFWDTLANYNAATPAACGALTRGPTSEAWTYFDCAPVGYNLTTCDMIIMVDPHHCVLHSYLNNEPSLWSGVFEVAREDLTDTAAANYPCWGWVSSTLWCLGAATIAAKPLATTDHTLICFPRTRSGSAGIAAARGWAADYGATAYPTWLITTGASFIYYLGNQVNKFISNAWDSTRRLALPIKPVADYSAAAIANYGQIFGLKVIAPIGVNMNKITLPVDSDGNAVPTGGTDRPHWLLNCHHKTYDNTNTTSWFTNGSWTNEVIACGGRVEKIVSVGANYYCMLTGGSKVVKVNAITKAITDVLVAGGYTDMRFGTERYLYVTSTTGITCLDIADDTTKTIIAISGGLSAVAINQDTVIAAGITQPTAGVTRFYRFVAPAVNQPSSAFVATTLFPTVDSPVAGASENQTVRDIICDHEGNAWAVGLLTTGLIANFRILRVTASGSIACTAYTIANPAAMPSNVCLQQIDGNNMILWSAVTSSVIYQVTFNPRTLLNVNSQNVGTASALTPNTDMSAIKVQGALLAVPRGSGVADNVFVNSLGRSATVTAPLAPIFQLDQSTLQGWSSANQFVLWDGARIIAGTETGIKLYSNVNGGLTVGGNPITNMNLGQVAIPA